MVIGITGRKRSGKDTVAAHFVSNHSYVRYQIAGPLKRALCELYGWDINILEDGSDKEKVDPEYGVSPREAAQFMGAEFNKYMSNHYPEYGQITNTKLYLKRMKQFVAKNPKLDIVIPDVRMPFTAEAIREMGGIMLRIERGKGANTDGHDTEKYIDTIEVDHVILNDGTIEQLLHRADFILGCEGVGGAILRNKKNL